MLAGFTYKTVEQNICLLRAFFRFLYQEGTVSTDFAEKMPMVKARKQTAIPSVWTHEELQQLICTAYGTIPSVLRRRSSKSTHQSLHGESTHSYVKKTLWNA